MSLAKPWYLHIFHGKRDWISRVISDVYPGVENKWAWIHLVGGFRHVLCSISYMGCHPSHWRTPSFFKMGRSTTNHSWSPRKMEPFLPSLPGWFFCARAPVRSPQHPWWQHAQVCMKQRLGEWKQAALVPQQRPNRFICIQLMWKISTQWPEVIIHVLWI